MYSRRLVLFFAVVSSFCKTDGVMGQITFKAYPRLFENYDLNRRPNNRKRKTSDS